MTPTADYGTAPSAEVSVRHITAECLIDDGMGTLIATDYVRRLMRLDAFPIDGSEAP